MDLEFAPHGYIEFSIKCAQGGNVLILFIFLAHGVSNLISVYSWLFFFYIYFGEHGHYDHQDTGDQNDINAYFFLLTITCGAHGI